MKSWQPESEAYFRKRIGSWLPCSITWFYPIVASPLLEEQFTHEAVRLWYRKIGQNLPHPNRIERHVIAVDETKLKDYRKTGVRMVSNRCRKIRGTCS